MHFSDIKLPGLLVAGLYKKSLVALPPDKNKIEKPSILPKHVTEEVPVPELVTEQVPVPELIPEQVPVPDLIPEHVSYLGNNQRNVLIMVSYPGEKHIPAGQLQFLFKVLMACKLEEKDIAIVNLFEQQPSFKSLQEQLRPVIILFFGITPQAIRLQQLKSLFSPEQQEGMMMATYPALEMMQEDNLLKSKLWLTLKQLFNV
jgi:hypothetical protein